MGNKIGCITVWFGKLATHVFTIKKDKIYYISSHLVVSFPHRPLFHELLVHFPRVHFFELSLIDKSSKCGTISITFHHRCSFPVKTFEFVFSPLNYCFFFFRITLHSLYP